MPRRRKEPPPSDVDQIVDEPGVDADGEDVDMAVDSPPEDDDVTEDKDEEDENSDLDALSDSPGGQREMGPSTQPQPRLRIKLKFGGQQTAVSTPDENPTPSSRRAISRDIDIESEDEEDEVDEDDDDDDAQSMRSTSVATAGTSKALTARQAVLANVVDASHVSLGPTPNSRKKKPLTEMELALKREETARKRRNLTEKKLEDEKTETINRLLKKQSRARGKRNALATAEDRPATGGGGDDEEGAEAEPPQPIIPTMYHWVSTSRVFSTLGAEGLAGTEKKMSLSFSVPASVLPPIETSKSSTPTAMDVDKPAPLGDAQVQATCDVRGCSERRKYRLVRDFAKGACGMTHLKALEAQLA
ncbi:PAPA-1-like conserved region-domain-containing protein [Fomitopsis betulina]|nr:PAPA-1-like conserved region-domain-containing protein [Fomitopsis betulina]